jgi:hypothetical protein
MAEDNIEAERRYFRYLKRDKASVLFKLVILAICIQI